MTRPHRRPQPPPNTVQKRAAALQWLLFCTDAQIAEMTAESLVRARGLPMPDARELLERERGRRRARG